MANLMNFCRVATTFSVNGEFDEDAFRQYLQRFIDTNTGVYLGSGGSGFELAGDTRPGRHAATSPTRKS